MLFFFAASVPWCPPVLSSSKSVFGLQLRVQLVCPVQVHHVAVQSRYCTCNVACSLRVRLGVILVGVETVRAFATSAPLLASLRGQWTGCSFIQLSKQLAGSIQGQVLTHTWSRVKTEHAGFWLNMFPGRGLASRSLFVTLFMLQLLVVA